MKTPQSVAFAAIDGARPGGQGPSGPSRSASLSGSVRSDRVPIGACHEKQSEAFPLHHGRGPKKASKDGGGASAAKKSRDDDVELEDGVTTITGETDSEDEEMDGKGDGDGDR